MQPNNDQFVAFSSDGIASPAIDFHVASGTFRTEFDGHTRPASEAVVTAVAVATGKDPLELPPLYSSIDPDALDALFDTPAHGASDHRQHVAFEYADCRVIANLHGTVVVEPDITDE